MRTPLKSEWLEFSAKGKKQCDETPYNASTFHNMRRIFNSFQLHGRFDPISSFQDSNNHGSFFCVFPHIFTHTLVRFNWTFVTDDSERLGTFDRPSIRVRCLGATVRWPQVRGGWSATRSEKHLSESGLRMVNFTPMKWLNRSVDRYC